MPAGFILGTSAANIPLEQDQAMPQAKCKHNAGNIIIVGKYSCTHVVEVQSLQWNKSVVIEAAVNTTIHGLLASDA